MVVADRVHEVPGVPRVQEVLFRRFQNAHVKNGRGSNRSQGSFAEPVFTLSLLSLVNLLNKTS